MARSAAVFCVLILFAAAVYSQSSGCDGITGTGATLTALLDTTGALEIDATAVSSLNGKFTIDAVTSATGAGSLTLDVAKNAGWKVAKVPGKLTVTKPTVAAGASQMGVNVLVTVALAGLALLSQRGSFVALALVFAVATVALAACAAKTSIEVVGTVDSTVSKLSMKFKVNVKTNACDSITVAGALASEVKTLGPVAGVCTLEWTNLFFGCKNDCRVLGPNVATATCDKGACVLSCKSGFLDCSATAAGCEAVVGSTATCGTTCAAAKDCSTEVKNAVGVCDTATNTCTVENGVCPAGFSDCDSNLANGCEATSSATACGSCDLDCTALPGVDAATATCNPTSLTCEVTCTGDNSDCDNDPNTGCEGDLTSDTDCGTCGNDCSDLVTNNAVSGTCDATTQECDFVCNTNFDDCDPNLQGCETDTSSNPKGCGTCNNDCTALAGVESSLTTCAAGVCQIACATGNADCNGDATDGCEVVLGTDAAHCGACPNDCSKLPGLTSPVCNAGVCEGPCAAGSENCTPDKGVGCPSDVSSDALNCGLCGNSCPTVVNAVPKCVASACDVDTCKTTFQNCDNDGTNGCESDKQTDKKNCGACGTACDVSGAAGNWASTSCAAGVCSVSCTAGFQDCNTDYKDGCEVKTNTDVNNCGTCGKVCALPNVATNVCNTGACETGTCAPGFAQCGALPGAGCPINQKTDANNCATCGNKCSILPNVAAGITCVGGVCATSAAGACATGFNDCDGVVANGCEVKTSVCGLGGVGSGSRCNLAAGYTTPAYNGFDCSSLGAAQNVVAATCATIANASAPLGQCFIRCAATHSDCDKDPTNGCETPVTSCDSSLTSGLGCETALKDSKGVPVSCLALASDPKLNKTVVLPLASPVCQAATGLCSYACDAAWFDCDGSASNGCEINKALCNVATAADCVFDQNNRCSSPDCVDCTKLSGSAWGTSTCVTTAGVSKCNFVCGVDCNNTDGDWTNGCEMALGYAKLRGGFPVDCSKDVDTTHTVDHSSYCDGNSGNTTQGFCIYECAAGWADCDDSPLNGCETDLTGDCSTCNYGADVSCGKNKCVDCTLLEGTLGVDYANGRDASASASTCIPDNETLDERLTDFTCDTSVHYLNPRFDAPSGDNGACQSELCRDLDENWENGCESAQGYGRGRFYFYGDEDNLDSLMVPYVSNPYEERYNEFKALYVEFDTTSNTYVQKSAYDIKILAFINRPTASGGLGGDILDYEWEEIVGEITYLESGVRVAPDYEESILSGDAEYPSDALAFLSTASPVEWAAYSAVNPQANAFRYLTGRDIALLHYAPDNFNDVIDPADAADLAIIGDVYLTPVDCVLSEWSDWGLCAYADDCIEKDYWLQSRIRTREVVTPASGGGVCHLPLVEDFYRFLHRASVETSVSDVDGFKVVNVAGNLLQGNSGTDYQRGGGLSVRMDYTNQGFIRVSDNDINDVLLWGPNDWAIEDLQNPAAGIPRINEPLELSWTGGVLEGVASNVGDNNLVPDSYARLLTCTAVGTCPDTNQKVPKAACDITAWSEWSRCSAECDGDWAGGVRIRTRTVLSGAAALGECFETEFDPDNGNPLKENAGMLYEEDWQCNDHSCSSYNCTLLRTPTAAQHIYLGADGILPVCDGRDWPEYVKDVAWVDANRDGWDDNNLWGFRNEEPRIIGGNFPLWNTIYNFTYEYRWPGHCLYECEEGWFDCNHDPRDGCEVDGDKCSLDAEFGSPAQLSHPILPWEHPHGDCTLAWKHDKSGVVARDCTDFVENHDELDHTVGLCVPETGLCNLTCDDGYANCEGDGCVPVDGTEDYCGYACVDCKQLNKFRYGFAANEGGDSWHCKENDDEDDWVCEPIPDDCLDGCENNDDDLYNGCETATYQQWPYPDVTPVETEVSAWSAWTQCTHSDVCGYLWDIDIGVFRHVPIQTRSRQPTKSAYNGGWYPEIKYAGRDFLEIEGVVFPENDPETGLDDALDPNFGTIGEQPELEDILGIPLVQTPLYEVRVCPTLPAPCIECTNQLEGLEEHCVLSEWSDWSACTAECMDRIDDPEFLGTTLDDVPDHRMWELDYDDGDYDDSDVVVTDRTPYQIRSRTVVTPARRGGRCPPPGDTWQVAEADSHVELSEYNDDGEGAYINEDLDWPAEGGLLDDLPSADNDMMSAKASYLVDLRKCNTEKCEYPEDCDALNYWYPGHFETIATCRPDSRPENVVSSCVAVEGLLHISEVLQEDSGCNQWNGYCNDVNGDLRDGCDTYIYPTHCGRVVLDNAASDNNECDYDLFRDCTTLPGVVSPFAAPCVIDQYTANTNGDADTNEVNYDSTTFAKPNAPNDTKHICDIRWACNVSACTDESFQANKNGWGWLDGCEVARNYRYPFVTVDSAFPYDNLNEVVGNPISIFFDDVEGDLDNDENNEDNEWILTKNLFWDPLNLYNLSQPRLEDNSLTFSFDCQGFLYSTHYCGDDDVKEDVLWQGEILDEDDDVVSNYPLNEGCHLRGREEADQFDELGFGCNGVWKSATDKTFGTCVMKCAAGYYDADLDPRNGCETDTLINATPEDKYVWVGNCKAASGVVPVTSNTSCGADLCVDCTALPGVVPIANVNERPPSCSLIEESINKIPVLAESEDYYAIQYACGALSANGVTTYEGEVNFDDMYCGPLCADGDGDWTNGCEQGRGYTDGAKYQIGAEYDAIFDLKNYLLSNNPACTPDFIADEATTGCDPRSSGFEMPVPGAWFYNNITSVPGDEVLGIGLSSYEAEGELTDFLDDLVTLNSLLSAAGNAQYLAAIRGPVAALNNRAYDCSLLFSTELMFDADEEYIPETVAVDEGKRGINAIYTFAQVHHIDTTKYKWNNPNGVCNRTTGMCQYECAAGWGDYDLDPSNGCEADLSGPCGLPTPLGLKTYFQVTSCGEHCTNCQRLPGSYLAPVPVSECLIITPTNFVDEEKADYVLETVRFTRTCTTEVIRPSITSDVAWQSIVCNPLDCFDANFDYEDGCELAVDYPFEWAENSKTSYNHWVSPIADADGAHSFAETTYWLRDDGHVTIGRSRDDYTGVALNGYITRGRDTMEPTDNTWDHWVELFDMLDNRVGVLNGEFVDAAVLADKGYTLKASEDRTDFTFGTWDVREVAGYVTGKWYGDLSTLTGASLTAADAAAKTATSVNGYGYFPYVIADGDSATYDCSNADLPSGTDWVPISDDATIIRWVEVDWTLTTSMKGPWFHVNQSAFAKTGCNPGYDPAALMSSYANSGRDGWGPVINPMDYCWTVSRTNPTPPTGFYKACFDAWSWPGSGLCWLDCESGWADRDADPTNGCESKLSNGFPLPRSKCGSTGSAVVFDDPATFNLTGSTPNYNFNQDGYCGAGICVSCQGLSGVNPSTNAGKIVGGANTVSGTKAYCVDGGDDWVDADNSINDNPSVFDPTNAVKYPGDYYCAGVTNQNACLRAQLSYVCVDPNDKTNCPNGRLWASSDVEGETITANTIQYPNAGYAEYFQVCEDRDELWTTGCEVALGYNLYHDTADVDVVIVDGDQNNADVTLQGVYDRSIGVKPKWDNTFTEIGWDGSVEPGFDCDVLRLLPREHTHVTPQTPTANFIGCSSAGNQGVGTCQFSCDSSWSDCDGNPWNGCEQSDVLCAGSGSGAACEDPQRYPTGTAANGNTKPTACDALPSAATDFARTAFCDGNQLPTDDWYDYLVSVSGRNDDDEGEYDELFEIYDHGIDWVDVTTDYVEPDVSRYTIQGYWDNDEIDYSCRVWLDFYSFTSVTLRTKNISADANVATGRCVVDCDEVGGVSNYNGIDKDGCQAHTLPGFCRTADGDSVTSCLTLPGVSTPSSSKCLSTIGNITVNWATNAQGLTGVAGVPGTSAVKYIVKYGFDTPISPEWPQCDTRGATAGGTACNDLLCRDYDGDWENGCEFPMAYQQAERDEWETEGALYSSPDVEAVDGFDCSWIADPQPDAGGRNYDGKTWAQKYHVDVSNVNARGQCQGNVNLPNPGKCNYVCAAGWEDCDLDPSNGCETDQTKCESCVVALGYADGVKVNCTTLVDEARGFVAFQKAPVCQGREEEDGECAYYFCNIWEGFCDSGLGAILSDDTKGCVNLTSSADDTFCGADWNWRDIRGNESTVDYDITVDPDTEEVTVNTEDYEGAQMLDYSNFDGTGRCATCTNLDGYMSEDAFCQKDPSVAGHTFDLVTFFKPAAGGWIDNSLGEIEFNTAGNTVGDYLCQLHGVLGADDDGACDRNLCVDEDYYWANGCETAVNYNHTYLSNATAGSSGDQSVWESQRHLEADVTSDERASIGFDYHFAFGDVVFGRDWPYNPNVDGNVVQKDTIELERNEIRGIWCPFIQFWSLSTDNYETGDCDVFPCPHLAPTTVDSWVTCVNNATAENAGKCNFVCNTNAGWEDCDQDPMTGCETDIFNDGTCGSECQRIECNTLAGLNPFYWSECLQTVDGSSCDLSICESDLCVDMDNDWTNGCETAVNYPGTEEYDCGALLADATLHLATVEQCNGEPGNHWAGKCEFTCEAGWVDCDGKFSNGCEHDGSLCQDCTKALGYVTHFDGAQNWENWGSASSDDMFYSVVYGSRFDQDSLSWDYDLVNNDTKDSDGTMHNTFEGPNVAYAEFHHAFVAAFDCSTLNTTYPGQFSASTPIRCDSDVGSLTAGRCVYACDAGKGYFDCDGDPRNGCEHTSGHQTCGGSGACRDCYYISGVDYPVDEDDDVAGTNNGAQGPYYIRADGTVQDVYDQENVTYFSQPWKAVNGPQFFPDRFVSPLRLGCVKITATASEYSCNLWSCEKVDSTYCLDKNQPSWKDGCERALSYRFNATAEGKYFDCSLMGPDASNNDMPRNTSTPNTPSFHIRQKVGTNGCDSHNVTDTGSPYEGLGAWRYILAREGRVFDYTSATDTFGVDHETEGHWAFDYDGLDNYFRVNDDFDVNEALELTVDDFVIWRVRGDDKIGTCYYECEYGYDDCNGDPRDGCEILLSACADRDLEIGWDWERNVATNGCETALGYTQEQLNVLDESDPEFDCTVLLISAAELHVNGTLPVYCRGGQDGNIADLGTCEFTCEDGWQDCDGKPVNGCEKPINNLTCGHCVSCSKYLPGTLSQSDDLDTDAGSTSQSTCAKVGNDWECTVPCNATLCADKDGDWTNGCEVALQYPTPRLASPIAEFDCATWAKDFLKAKKDHINTDLLDKVYCEGRWPASDAGQCNYQSACSLLSAGAIHDWQDCDSDPRNGCEDTNRWCSNGLSASSNVPRGTGSDLCSEALNFYCDAFGFDARGELCEDGVELNAQPFDCFLLGTAGYVGHHIIATPELYPYCDRDVTHLDSRGECVFTCVTGWADCNDDVATDGCEANVSLTATCDYDCINCDVLPGIDRAQPHACVEDAAATLLEGTKQYRCQYKCVGADLVPPPVTNCADKDREWQNGCEVAQNVDTDDLAVFMNEGQPMDCSVMEEEAVKNPDLFRHHLHIDLDATILTLASNADGPITLEAGSIFCNEGLISGYDSGKCYFACIEGFSNANRLSYDGCEAVAAAVTYPYAYGGYMIGDYDVEEYIEFLLPFNFLGSGVSVPRNLALMHNQISALMASPIMWY